MNVTKFYLQYNYVIHMPVDNSKIFTLAFISVILPAHMLLFRQQNAGQNHDIKIETDVLKSWHSSYFLERL
jgi:hypothetical protein